MSTPDLTAVWSALEDYGSACYDVGLQQVRDEQMKFMCPTVALTDARRWRNAARHHLVDALNEALGVEA